MNGKYFVLALILAALPAGTEGLEAVYSWNHSMRHAFENSPVQKQHPAFIPLKWGGDKKNSGFRQSRRPEEKYFRSPRNILRGTAIGAGIGGLSAAFILTAPLKAPAAQMKMGLGLIAVCALLGTMGGILTALFKKEPA